MSKKMKTLVAVVVALLVLTVGSTAMVIAQDEEPAPPPTPEIESNAFLQKVAEILGISVEELISIFQEARQEMRQDAFQRFLNRAVEEERITEEEAQQILEWWEQRPEACDRLLLRARICQATRSRQMQQQGIGPMPGGRIWESPKGPRGWHSTAPPWLAQ